MRSREDWSNLEQKKSKRSLSRLDWLLIGLTVLFVLIWRLPPMHLPQGELMALWLHTLSEMFSIVVDLMIFGIAWNTYRTEQPGNILIVGCALLSVGLLDIAHMLSFRGMPDFVTPAGPEKAINFWLSARLISALAMLVIALRPWRPFYSASLRYAFLAGSLTMTVGIYWLGLFHQAIWPRTYIEGSGLTSFKVGAEYVVCSILLAASMLFWRRSKQSRNSCDAQLFAATAVTILSECSFTLYADVTDLFNLLGHVYKVIAYIFIYRAVFVASVHEPYRRLHEVGEELNFQKMLLDAQGEASIDGILSVGDDGRILWFNRRFLEMWEIPREVVESCSDDAVNRYALDKLIDADAFAARVRYLNEHHNEKNHREIQLKNGQVFEFYSSPVLNNNGVYLARVWCFRDVTERKRAERELKDSYDLVSDLLIKVERAREEEREKTVRDIHDDVGQLLTAISFDIAYLEKNQPDELKSVAQNARELVNRVVERIQHIAAGMHPSLLDMLDLRSAMEWHAVEFQKKTGINCMVTSKPLKINLEKDLSHDLFRVFTEALNNVARHSKATEASVSLEKDGERVRLEIRDNGVGFNMDGMPIRKVTGLAGMKARLRPWGGGLVIESGEGRGTTVTASLSSAGRQKEAFSGDMAAKHGDSEV